MPKIIIIADTHIPERASWIPSGIESVLMDEVRNSDILIHGGDLVSEDVLKWAKSLTSMFYVVAGNMDYLDLPERVKFHIDDIYIGVLHGHQVYPRGNLDQLTDIAREMNVHVLISAHTHRPLVKEYRGIVHLNPGSLTGVWGGGGGSMKPSFLVINVSDRKRLNVILYEQKEDRIEKQEFNFNISF